MSLLELIKTGGWTMYPLALCSVVVWSVVAERLWTLRKWKSNNREFLLAFSNAWLQGNKDAAHQLCASSEVDLAPIAYELVSYSDSLSPPALRARVDRKRAEISFKLKRMLWILGTIGSAAPFIGLFGTVVGIIRSFTSMSQTGAGGFAVVSAGISEALVATAAGIFVAVLSVFFFNYLQVKISDFQFTLKLLTEELWDHCVKNTKIAS